MFASSSWSLDAWPSAAASIRTLGSSFFSSSAVSLALSFDSSSSSFLGGFASFDFTSSFGRSRALLDEFLSLDVTLAREDDLSLLSLVLWSVFFTSFLSDVDLRPESVLVSLLLTDFDVLLLLLLEPEDLLFDFVGALVLDLLSDLPLDDFDAFSFSWSTRPFTFAELGFDSVFFFEASPLFNSDDLDGFRSLEDAVGFFFSADLSSGLLFADLELDSPSFFLPSLLREGSDLRDRLEGGGDGDFLLLEQEDDVEEDAEDDEREDDEDRERRLSFDEL